MVLLAAPFGCLARSGLLLSCELAEEDHFLHRSYGKHIFAKINLKCKNLEARSQIVVNTQYFSLSQRLRFCISYHECLLSIENLCIYFYCLIYSY